MIARLRATESLTVQFSIFVVAGAAACSSGSANPSGTPMNRDDAGPMGSGAPGQDSGPVMALPSSEPVAPVTFDALFVVNGGDSSISLVNAATNELAGTIQLKDASFPHHVYLSQDRTKMLLAVPGMDMSKGHEGGMPGRMGAVMLLDAKTGATIKSRMTDAMNHNAIFSPDGSEIWTSQMSKPGSLLILDPSTLDTMQTIPVGDQPAEITFSVDGKYAFVANGGSASVTVIDPKTKAVVKTVSVGDDPVGAWQGSNGVAYVDNEAAKTLTAIDTKTLSVKLTYNLGFMPGMAALGPDGNLWATDEDHGKVFLDMTSMDTKLSEITVGDGAHAIAFSGDGKTGYITDQLANSVSVIDIGTRKVTKTIPVGQKPNGMVWRAQ